MDGWVSINFSRYKNRDLIPFTRLGHDAMTDQMRRRSERAVRLIDQLIGACMLSSVFYCFRYVAFRCRCRYCFSTLFLSTRNEISGEGVAFSVLLTCLKLCALVELCGWV